MGLFDLVGKTLDLTKNVVDIAVAPVEIAVDVTNEVLVKPIKEVTDELVEEMEDINS